MAKCAWSSPRTFLGETSTPNRVPLRRPLISVGTFCCGETVQLGEVSPRATSQWATVYVRGDSPRAAVLAVDGARRSSPQKQRCDRVPWTTCTIAELHVSAKNLLPIWRPLAAV